jgi:hypothetical protein
MINLFLEIAEYSKIMESKLLPALSFRNTEASMAWAKNTK